MILHGGGHALQAPAGGAEILPSRPGAAGQRVGSQMPPVPTANRSTPPVEVASAATLAGQTPPNFANPDQVPFGFRTFSYALRAVPRTYTRTVPAAPAVPATAGFDPAPAASRCNPSILPLKTSWSPGKGPESAFCQMV